MWYMKDKMGGLFLYYLVYDKYLQAKLWRVTGELKTISYYEVPFCTCQSTKPYSQATIPHNFKVAPHSS